MNNNTLHALALIFLTSSLALGQDVGFDDVGRAPGTPVYDAQDPAAGNPAVGFDPGAGATGPAAPFTSTCYWGPDPGASWNTGWSNGWNNYGNTGWNWNSNWYTNSNWSYNWSYGYQNPTCRYPSPYNHQNLAAAYKPRVNQIKNRIKQLMRYYNRHSYAHRYYDAVRDQGDRLLAACRRGDYYACASLQQWCSSWESALGLSNYYGLNYAY